MIGSVAHRALALGELVSGGHLTSMSQDCRQLWIGCKYMQSRCLRAVPSAVIQQRCCAAERSVLSTSLTSSMFEAMSQRRALSSSSSSRSKSKYKIAVVGSGPGGCYTAKYLRAGWEKQQAPKNLDCASDNQADAMLQIDILERLPTPFGEYLSESQSRRRIAASRKFNYSH
jgi:hypothetical protein